MGDRILLTAYDILKQKEAEKNNSEGSGDADSNKEVGTDWNDVYHHSLMRKKIVDLEIFRSYIPITLLIGASEVGKSTLASVLASNHEITTIFDTWNEVTDWVAVEKEKIKDQRREHILTDEATAKTMTQTVVLKPDKKGGKSETIESDTTHNRPRSLKYTNLIEAVYDKEFVLDAAVSPAIEVLSTKRINGKMYKPGEIPVVYYNESLQDAIFHFDAFILIATEGQESGGSRHRITLQVKRQTPPTDISSMSKKDRMLGSSYVEDIDYGEKYVTCFPVDLMVFFALVGPVRVTSVNSSTFSSKNVVSNTQKGGLSDSVINTPNYISNTIRQFGGMIIIEIRDDWDKADTLFGAGDMAIEISRNDNDRSIVSKFRLRDGSLGKREYYALRYLYEIVFSVVLRCVEKDLKKDLELLASLMSFMDNLILFSNEQKLKIERLLLDDNEPNLIQTKEEQTHISRFYNALEDYIYLCDQSGMTTESSKFKLMKKIFLVENHEE